MSDPDVPLDESSSSSKRSVPSSNPDDKPNITVDGQKEVHLNITADNDENEGSIVAAPEGDYPIDSNKDPQIKPVQKDTSKEQSKCCLLL